MHHLKEHRDRIVAAERLAATVPRSSSRDLRGSQADAQKS
jgi:hypothetical protein